MSIKSKMLAAVATLATVGGVGTAGVLGTAATANAATPSCGPTCVGIFGQEFGHHGDPGFLLDVFQQYARIGQPIILYRASTSDPAEDFRLEFQGTVAGFLAAQMVTPAFALHYGCIPVGTGGGGSGNFPDCFGLGKTFNDPAFEIEYTPDGVDSGLCAGVASTAVQNENVSLQECGASSKTVWAVDIYDQPIESFFLHYYPLINGSDTNFSQPFVLSYPQTSYPTYKPRPQLQVDYLSGYTTGFPPILNYPSIDDNQIWGADTPSLLRTRREAVARSVRARTAPPGEHKAARSRHPASTPPNQLERHRPIMTDNPARTLAGQHPAHPPHSTAPARAGAPCANPSRDGRLPHPLILPCGLRFR